MFFAGVFAGAGYVVESNKENGAERSDIIVQAYADDRAAIFEVKYSKAKEKLVQDCKNALVQIEDRKYIDDLQEYYSQMICYGIL